VAAARAAATTWPTRRNVPFIELNFAKASLSLVLLLVIALAVRQDLRERRISNVLALTGVIAGTAIQAVAFGMTGFLNALAGAGVGMACFLPLYLCKGMGAGDVKLMGAAGAFFGPANALIAALLSLACGAVLALVVLVWRAVELRSAAVAAPGAPAEARALSQLRALRFPYAAAIAMGVTATLWWSGMAEDLIP
jgi:prepilin peptidase CpaA